MTAYADRERARLIRRDRRRRDVLCERRFQLWLTAAEYEALVRIAREDGCSMAQVLKRLLGADVCWRAARGRVA